MSNELLFCIVICYFVCLLAIILTNVLVGKSSRGCEVAEQSDWKRYLESAIFGQLWR